jgi:hypothetical protein
MDCRLSSEMGMCARRFREQIEWATRAFGCVRLRKTPPKRTLDGAPSEGRMATAAWATRPDYMPRSSPQAS